MDRSHRKNLKKNEPGDAVVSNNCVNGFDSTPPFIIKCSMKPYVIEGFNWCSWLTTTIMEPISRKSWTMIVDDEMSLDKTRERTVSWSLVFVNWCRSAIGETADIVGWSFHSFRELLKLFLLTICLKSKFRKRNEKKEKKRIKNHNENDWFN